MTRKQRETLNNLVGKLIDKYPVSAEGNHSSFMTFNRFATIQNVFNMQEYYNEKRLLKTLSARKLSYFRINGGRAQILLYTRQQQSCSLPMVETDQMEKMFFSSLLTDYKLSSITIDNPKKAFQRALKHWK